ncbi:MAG: ester cyclase [Gluconacetobacter diazotrophicus]|nr:ester cyclase [Gluconacetobacter diazotrophicus]
MTPPANDTPANDTESRNKQVARAYFPAFVSGDRAWWREHVSPDFLRHDPGLPYEVRGIPGLQHHHDVVLAGIPDLHLPIHHVMEERDHVLVRLRFRGTHTGEFAGQPPTGNPIDVEVFDLFRLAGGRLAEHWAMVDTLSLLKQLGATTF